MKLTSSSRARRSVCKTSGRFSGSPQTPRPVMRMAPKPSRLTVKLPILKTPPALAVILLLKVTRLGCCPRPKRAAASGVLQGFRTPGDRKYDVHDLLYFVVHEVSTLQQELALC